MQPWNRRHNTLTRRHSEPKKASGGPKEGKLSGLGRSSLYLGETGPNSEDTNLNSEQTYPNQVSSNPNSQTSNSNTEGNIPDSESSPDPEDSPDSEIPKTSLNFSWFHTLVLENKGSVARDHLANERTYLAWIRTSLMMMTLALAFLQMYSVQVRAKEALYNGHVVEISSGPKIEFLRQMGRPLGVLAGVFSILVVFSGLYRYFSVQRALCRDTFPASRFLVAGLVVCCVTVMVMILVVDSKT